MDEASVIAQVQSLDVAGPFLTRDELWLTAYVDSNHGFTPECGVHINVSTELTGGELVSWVEGPGHTTYRTGNPVVMSYVVAEVAANPKAAYTRARKSLRSIGGLPLNEIDSPSQSPVTDTDLHVIPQRWARRHLDWMFTDESEADFDRRMAAPQQVQGQLGMVQIIGKRAKQQKKEDSRSDPAQIQQLELL